MVKISIDPEILKHSLRTGDEISTDDMEVSASVLVQVAGISPYTVYGLTVAGHFGVNARRDDTLKRGAHGNAVYAYRLGPCVRAIERYLSDTYSVHTDSTPE